MVTFQTGVARANAVQLKASETIGRRRIASASCRRSMKYSSFIILFACGVVVIAPTISGAQDDTYLQLWADYHAHYFKNAQIEWYGDGGLRVLPDDFSWVQAYVRPSLRFHRRKHFDVHAGLGLIYTYNEEFADALEVRPWQGIKFKWPTLGGLDFSHYFRFEQRMSFSDGRGDLALRFRYKLGTKIILKKASGGKILAPLFIPVSVELFADTGPNIDPLFGSRGRFDIGLGYTAGEEWVGELHLIVQASRSGLDQQLETSEYILRLQFKHLLTSKNYNIKKEDIPE